MSKYSDIHSADELQNAIKGIRTEIKSQEKVLSVKYDGLHEHYRPSNMVAGFLKRNSDYYNWADVSLRIVKALKNKVGGIKRPAKPVQTDQWIGDEPAFSESYDEDRDLKMDSFAGAGPEVSVDDAPAADEKTIGDELKDAARAFMSEVRDKVANDDIA